MKTDRESNSSMECIYSGVAKIAVEEQVIKRVAANLRVWHSGYQQDGSVCS